MEGNTQREAVEVCCAVAHGKTSCKDLGID